MLSDKKWIIPVAKRIFDASYSPLFEAREMIKAAETEEQLEDMIERRIAREPLQYILGEWEFYSLPFKLGPGVLIPRPDTETLVDTVLEFIGDREVDCVDLCSGSGCIAVAIAANRKNARVTAVEKSDEAFKYLEENIALNGVSVTAVKGDILTDSFGEYDLIVSNPPYVRTDVIPRLQPEVAVYEPKMALDGGEDGLRFYRAIAEKWLPRLRPGGMLAVEIGYDQDCEVAEIFKAAGLKNVLAKRDLENNRRVVFGTLDKI